MLYPLRTIFLSVSLLEPRFLTAASATGPSVLVVNRGEQKVHVVQPIDVEIPPRKSWRKAVSGTLQLLQPPLSIDVPQAQYRVVVVDKTKAAAYDANDLQLELSAAAHACIKQEPAPGDKWQECVAKRTFGGLPVKFVRDAFGGLWQTFEYWSLCEAEPPTTSMRTLVTNSGHSIDILREVPRVAAVRGFLGAEECSAVMGKAGYDKLVRAHLGTGGGSTMVSETRETLSTNLFVDWNKEDALSSASARMFDLASEMIEEKVPYEGQEPLNFLHYLRGFEYKPHYDGSGERTGKRVATTLVYCEAPAEGGATVFPANAGAQGLKFAPGPGDLLFFQYMPNPGQTLHAACPVGRGNKSTLTQWHRLGVSPDKPWDLFEDWGRFHNPHIGTRWKGPRYGGQEL